MVMVSVDDGVCCFSFSCLSVQCCIRENDNTIVLMFFWEMFHSRQREREEGKKGKKNTT